MSPPSCVAWLGGPQLLEVPEGKVGRLIGRGGAVISALQDASGARLDISRESSSVTLRGSGARPLLPLPPALVYVALAVDARPPACLPALVCVCRRRPRWINGRAAAARARAKELVGAVLAGRTESLPPSLRPAPPPRRRSGWRSPPPPPSSAGAGRPSGSCR
eukprot:COSAG01_NODE_14062_length_1500_cov_3.410421_1_plen_162_part_10